MFLSSITCRLTTRAETEILQPESELSFSLSEFLSALYHLWILTQTNTGERRICLTIGQLGPLLHSLWKLGSPSILADEHWIKGLRSEPKVVLLAWYPNTGEAEARGLPSSLRPAWATWWIPETPGLESKHHFEQEQHKTQRPTF